MKVNLKTVRREESRSQLEEDDRDVIQVEANTAYLYSKMAK